MLTRYDGLCVMQRQAHAAELRDTPGCQRGKHTKTLQGCGLSCARTVKQRLGLFLELLEIRPLG